MKPGFWGFLPGHLIPLQQAWIIWPYHRTKWTPAPAAVQMPRIFFFFGWVGGWVFELKHFLKLPKKGGKISQDQILFFEDVMLKPFLECLETSFLAKRRAPKFLDRWIRDLR